MQWRKSGEPYIVHPLEVAAILAKHRMDVSTIITGLLHDTVEDTGATSELIADRFGDEVASMVDGVTKFTRLEMLKLALSREEEEKAEEATEEVNTETKGLSRAQSESENLRKLVLAMSTDIRVLLVKLTDRLHNMRTLRFVNSEQARRRKARETLAIYAPLADRLGMSRLCHELETLAFRELQPDAYASIVKQQQRHHYSPELQDMIRQMHHATRPASREASSDGSSGIYYSGRDSAGSGDRMADAPPMSDNPWSVGSSGTSLLKELHVRERSAYRIWRECLNSGLTVKQLLLKDFFSLVLIAPSTPACYHILGAVHSRCRASGEMRDYISTPRPNHYQSLHTTLIGPQKQMIDVMIRTSDMHLLAELGVVSLWQGELEYPWRSAHEYHSGWISSLRGVAESAASPDDFMELTQMELFPDQVFCLTPKGTTIGLPKGGTPLDFAYAIHSKLGNTCKRAIVNGKPQPLHTKLRNGDLVEITTSASSHPLPTWEDIVVTGRARAEIRRTLNLRRRRAAELNGRRELSRALRFFGLSNATETEVLAAARALPSTSASMLANITEVYTNVAAGKIPPQRLVAVLRQAATDAEGAAADDALEPSAAVQLPTTNATAEAGADLGSRPPLMEEVQGSVEFRWEEGNARWEVQLGARLTEASSSALATLAQALIASGATILSYVVRERDGLMDSVWVDVTIEIDEPHELPDLLASLRLLPQVERVRKVRIDPLGQPPADQPDGES